MLPFAFEVIGAIAWAAPAESGAGLRLVSSRRQADRRERMAMVHPVQIVRIQSVRDLSPCHVLFMSASHGRPAAMLPRGSGGPVLPFSDADDSLDPGGQMRMVEEPPRLSWRISVANLLSSGLASRAQLLRLPAKP